MAESPCEDQKKVVNQTNRGSGTFVAGNVLGNIVNFFVPTQRRRPPAVTRSESDGPADDDYHDIIGPLLASIFLAFIAGTAVLYCFRGEPLSGTGPAPGLLRRLVVGFAFAYGLVACVAVFFARVAQGLELWTGRCADTAMQTRVRFVAYLPASMARVMASACSVSATMAALVAIFYGWGDFGGSIQERAHMARDNAAVHAARARAATQRG